MSRLLFIFERDMPTISITREVFTNLNADYRIESEFKYLTDTTPTDIDCHDIIIFMRPDNLYSSKLAAQARRAGHIVVTFCDDDLLNLPKTAPSMPWRKKGLIKTLAQSDIIWSSSRYILEKYQKLTAGKRMAVSETIVRPEELDEVGNSRSTDTVRIVYAAAPSHAALFESYVGPIVPRLAEEFGEKISFTFISVHPEVEGVQCDYVPGMPLLQYRRYMKEQQFDIGLAPLHSDEFSKCKYINKFLEYTTHGMVGVYSKTEPYTYVVEDGVNGFLAENSQEAWFDAISRAIKDKDARKKCVENATIYIRNNHSETAYINRLRNDIPEICEIKSEYSKCRWFGLHKYMYYIMRPLDWIYLLVYYLKNTGVKAVIKRAKRHFVEAKAYNKSRKD